MFKIKHLHNFCGSKIVVFLILFLTTSNAWSQTITLRTFSAGSYSMGSDVSVLFDFSADVAFKVDNVFSLYLSGEDGTFLNETRIGEIEGFYSSFINGKIPASITPGTKYRLRIKASSPETVSEATVPFTVTTGNAIEAKLNSTYIDQEHGVLGLCSGIKNLVFYLSNESTPGAAVSAFITDEASDLLAKRVDFLSKTLPFSALQTHYSVFVLAKMHDGRLATKTYPLVNNRALTAFGTSGENIVSLPDALLQFNVTVSGADGIKNNYPGNIYIVNWGDGESDTVTIYDIIKNKGRLNHLYKEASYGHDVYIGQDTIYNAFGITISSKNEFCGEIGTPVSTFARVVTRPVADFLVEPICLGRSVVFENTSDPGLDPYSKNPNEKNKSVTYTWLVDGKIVPGAINQPKDFSLNYTFTKPGTHSVRLESSGNGPFTAVVAEKIVCVQAAPEPSFLLKGVDEGILMCEGEVLELKNTSLVDISCSAASYQWEITGGDVEYLDETDSLSHEPRIRFTKPGEYGIRLHINTSICGKFSTEEQRIVVNSQPVTMLSEDAVLCNLASYAYNPSTSGPSKVFFTGPDSENAGKFLWKVSGGAYEFINGTGPDSKFPVIDFKEYAIYTISATHTWNCGSSTDTQVLDFRPAPAVNAGAYDSLCHNGQLQLKGSINGAVKSFSWVGGSGTFVPGRNELNAVYIPSSAERESGQVKLTLRAETPLQAPCQVMEGSATIFIKKNNLISGVSEKQVCTGSSVDYGPQALPGSTFRWEVIHSSNVRGFSNGSGSHIEDVLICEDTASPAQVVYRVTPYLAGCEGESFDFKVSVSPSPVLSVSSVNEICNGQHLSIKLQTESDKTRYIWSSSVSGSLLTGNSQASTPVAVSQIEDQLINHSTKPEIVTYLITPVSEAGCTGETREVRITVGAPQPNMISSDQMVCAGATPALLKESGSIERSDFYSYQWEMSTDGGLTWAGVIGADQENYQPPILEETTLYRRLINNRNCPDAVASISNEVAITINPDAQAAFTFSNDIACAPFNLTEATIEAGEYEGNANYTWYANEEMIGTGHNFPGYTITKEGQVVNIKLVVTSTFGCESAEASHVFKTYSGIKALYTQSKESSCGTSQVSFTNQSATGSHFTYHWDFGNGQTSTSFAPDSVVFQPHPAGSDTSYTIKLRVRSVCGKEDSYHSTYLVKSAPKAVFSPDKTIGCSPMKVSFSNTSSENDGTTYAYDFGDGSPTVTSTGREPVYHTFENSGKEKVFVVKMTAKNECGESSSQHKIRVTPPTVVAELVVEETETIGCAPLSVDFHNNSFGGTSYHIDFGDGESVTSFTVPQKISHIFRSPGVYTVTLTAQNSCSALQTTETIRVLERPVAKFEVKGIKSVGESLRFVNLSTGGHACHWKFGDGTMSGKPNPEHIYQRPGLYQVTLIMTNYNGCQASFTSMVNIGDEAGELYVPNAFMPSAIASELRVFRPKGFGIDTYTLWVMNKWGEVIWQSSKLDNGQPAEGWDGTYQGTLLSPGIYFWKIEAVFRSGKIWEGMSYNGASPKVTGTINLIR